VTAPNRNFAPRPYKGDDIVLRRNLTDPEDASLIELLDRVLDHGIVVDPSSRIRLMALELHKANERLVIDWRDTYF